MSPAPRQPNILARATTLAGTALLAAALLAGSGATPATGWNQATAEATLWQLLNGARANNGLNVLVLHPTLQSLARWRSQDMINRDYFSHTVLGTNYQVYHWYDTNGLSYSLGGENIAWNSGYSDADSPVAAHNGFMNSPGHRDNVLRVGWTHGAVGAAAADGVMYLGSLRNPRLYTELFMTAAGGSAPPPPSGGGGGGSGGGSGGAQPAPAPTAPPRTVPAPVRPSPSEPLDGRGTLVHAPVAEVPDRAWATTEGREVIAPAVVTASLRVEAPAPSERGVFDTLLGALIGLLFG